MTNTMFFSFYISNGRHFKQATRPILGILVCIFLRKVKVHNNCAYEKQDSAQPCPEVLSGLSLHYLHMTDL